MALVVTVSARLRRPRRFVFEDDVKRVVVGRDPAQCQIVFARRVRAVGAEHCAFERILGRYRILLNGVDEVAVDGVPAVDGQELPDRCDVQLGARGPRLQIERRAAAGETPAPARSGGLPRVLSLRPVLRHMRMNRLLVLAALVIGALALGAGYAQGRRAGNREQSRALRTATEMARLEASLETRVRNLRTTLDEAAAGASPRPPALTERLRTAMSSVYRVVLRDAVGTERAMGTAWVAAPGRLATNAHVLQSIERFEGDAEVYVRGAVPPYRTHRVLAHFAHPGFDAFEALWSGYWPAEGVRLGNLAYVPSAGSACDVGVLTVDVDARLGDPLVLATEQELHAMRPGDVLGTIGFPAETVCLNGSPVQRPVAQVQFGHLTSVTTPFGDRGAPEENTLLQNSCPGAGGSSGSPLLDARGRVVGIVSAGNHGRSFGGRVPSGVGINYAQRVDLLAELLEGTADRSVPAWRARWQQRIETLYVSRYKLIRHARHRRRLEASSHELFVASGGVYHYRWHLVARKALNVPVAEDHDSGGVTTTLHFESNRQHLVYVSPIWWRAMSARLPSPDDSTTILRQDRYGEIEHIFPSYRSGEAVELALRSDRFEGRAEVFLYEARRETADVDDVYHMVVRRWLGMLDGELELSRYEPVLIAQKTRDLAADEEWVGKLAPRESGRYLIVCCAEDGDLARVELGPASRWHWGRDAWYAPYARFGAYQFRHTKGETDKPFTVKRLDPLDKEQRVHLRLYMAKEANR
ncbi:MAG: serine protease [Planctomycetota bacterium]|nr:serine protease [Planctomycetota bacterium]